MKILFVSGRSHFPEALGGVSRSTHDLALELQSQGHQVSVLCTLAQGGWTSLGLRLLRKLFGSDRLCGYPVYRQWKVLQNLGAFLRTLSPDVAIVQIGDAVQLAQAMEAEGVPVLFYLHNVDAQDLGGDPRTLSNTQFVGNSHFTAARYKALFGFDSVVIPPLVRAKSYVARRCPANVTLVNPHLVKGQEIALKVAEACPDIPFTFVESWPLSSRDMNDLHRRIARLPNVTFRRRTQDMKSIYRKAKILLAPSICEEAWGRVVTEGHFSGIPVVASDRGGLPEAVGPGGLLLDPEGPIEPWIEAVRQLWADPVFYKQKSDAAFAYSRRPEIQPGALALAVVDAATRLIGQRRVGAAQTAPA